MKKLFTLLFISTLFISCSQDNEVANMEQEALSFEQKLAKGDFDNSNLGIYKGLFSTNDGQTRAAILITLNGISEPSVEFTFPDFTKAVVRSSDKTNKGQAVKGMSFNDGDFDFTFKVNADGSNPLMENVIYKGQKGDVVVIKETTKNAVAAKTGSYTCESGCFTDGVSQGGDDTVPHPELGKPGSRQTFSFLQSNVVDPEAPGAETTVQFTLNTKVYTGNAKLVNCAPVLFSTLRRCGLERELNLNGRTGPFAFSSLAAPTVPQAFFTYNVGAGDCSTYEGTVFYRSTLFGRSVLSFRSDAGGPECF